MHDECGNRQIRSGVGRRGLVAALGLPIVAIASIASTGPAQTFPKTTPECAALFRVASCYNCHMLSGRIVGPAFSEISKRYAGDMTAEARLTRVILKGGSGQWGNIMMPPTGFEVLPNGRVLDESYAVTLARCSLTVR